MSEPDTPATKREPRPTTRDRQAWQAFWAAQGQAWRTEPEIDAERQAELAARRSLTPDVAQGIYPFRGIKLTRADLEWLLATHEHERGPVDYQDPSQRDRVGLDLRGADLSYAPLQNLPMARPIGDVTWRCWATLTEKQHRMAAMQFFCLTLLSLRRPLRSSASRLDGGTDCERHRVSRSRLLKCFYPGQPPKYGDRL